MSDVEKKYLFLLRVFLLGAGIAWGVSVLGLVLPWSVVWEIFLVNLLVKYGITLLSLPLIYIVPDKQD